MTIEKTPHIHFVEDTNQSYYYWRPVKAKGIVHIVHGVSEMVTRYQDLAEKLLQSNYIVVAYDHYGHGPRAKTLKQLGQLPNHPVESMLTQLDMIIKEVQSLHPDLPYFLLGHSMGGYITQVYLQLYSSHIDGIILSGVSGRRPWMSVLPTLSKVLYLFGRNKANRWLHRLVFGKWPTDDTLIGFPLTNGLFMALAYLFATKKRSHEIQKPTLLLIGHHDPLVWHLPLKINHWVTLMIYTHRGHEVLMYHGKGDVYQDILTWLDNEIDSIHFSLESHK